LLNTLKDTIAETPEATLVNMVITYGYFKRPDRLKKEILGKQYHKGFEVLISCRENEIAFIQGTCLQVNINTGKPF
jgi:hypothetical protein